MKTTIIVRAGAIVLGVFILVLLQVTSSYAARWQSGSYERSVNTSCSDKASFFPASLYTKINTNRNGSYSGFEIHSSSQDGECSSLLYSSNPTKSSRNLNRRQNDDDLLIVGR